MNLIFPKPQHPFPVNTESSKVDKSLAWVRGAKGRRAVGHKTLFAELKGSCSLKAEQIGSWQQIIFKSSCLSSFSSQTAKGFSVVSFGMVKELFPPLLSSGKGKNAFQHLLTLKNLCILLLQY